MKLEILGYAIHYSNNLSNENMHCNLDIAPVQPLLIGDDHIFLSNNQISDALTGKKKIVTGQITIYRNASPTSGILSFEEAGTSKFLDKNETSFLHAEIYIGDIGFSHLLTLLKEYEQVELELYFPGLNFLNPGNQVSTPTITWQKNRFTTNNAGSYEVAIDRFGYTFKEEKSEKPPIITEQKIEQNAIANQKFFSLDSINPQADNTTTKSEKLEFTCPSCNKKVRGKPPTICPHCKLGIPDGYEAMQVPQNENSPTSNDLDMQIELKDEMPLDTYAKKLKKFGF